MSSRYRGSPGRHASFRAWSTEARAQMTRWHSRPLRTVKINAFAVHYPSIQTVSRIRASRIVALCPDAFSKAVSAPYALMSAKTALISLDRLQIRRLYKMRLGQCPLEMQPVGTPLRRGNLDPYPRVSVGRRIPLIPTSPHPWAKLSSLPVGSLNAMSRLANPKNPRLAGQCDRFTFPCCNNELGNVIVTARTRQLCSNSHRSVPASSQQSRVWWGQAGPDILPEENCRGKRRPSALMVADVFYSAALSIALARPSGLVRNGR
jgi:hypothetical protein